MLTRMARSACALTACEPLGELTLGELTLACSPSRGTDGLCAFGRSAGLPGRRASRPRLGWARGPAQRARPSGQQGEASWIIVAGPWQPRPKARKGRLIKGSSGSFHGRISASFAVRQVPERAGWGTEGHCATGSRWASLRGRPSGLDSARLGPKPGPSDRTPELPSRWLGGHVFHPTAHLVIEKAFTSVDGGYLVMQRLGPSGITPVGLGNTLPGASRNQSIK